MARRLCWRVESHCSAFCYRRRFEKPKVECKVNRTVYLGIATFGALSAALLLAGCGRKGALDPPPGGYVVQSGPGRTPVSDRGLRPDQKKKVDGDKTPAAPEGPQRHILPDWLLD